MINNDILRRVSTIFNLSNEKILSIFDLGEYEVTELQLANYYQAKDNAAYIQLPDVGLASFLNGLIIEQRGKKDGPQRPAEQQITNNAIFNKVKIAKALKADDVIEILELSGVTLGKYELSAFFRNVNHKHYKLCSDEVLSAFLKGLKIQAQQ